MVLEKVCGEANRTLFVGFTDLFQRILNGLIPDWWPISVLEEVFDNCFDDLQDQMKPYAYEQGAEMGKRIEDAVEAWIKSKFDTAMSELNSVKNQALGEINAARNELVKHTAEIHNLIERVSALEGTSTRGIKLPPILERRAI